MKKKIMAGLIAGIFVFQCFAGNAYATGVVEVPAEQVESVYNQGVESNKMKDWPNGPHIYSESGIVMDMDSGAILYGKNIDDKHYPASITKILTALVVLENCDLQKKIKFSWDDVMTLEPGSSHIGMKQNEKITTEDALYAILLASANEVSNAVASNYEGGYEAFVAEMNRRAKELGCTNSNFVNTHGLHKENHYTTVRDMALIGAEVYKQETFRTVTMTKQYTIGKTNITKQKRVFQQKHKMLNQWSEHFYEYCTGGKTGYTTKSLNTLVTFASKDGMNLVAVVMRTHGGNTNAYGDTKKMFDYAFDNFSKKEVTLEELQNKDFLNVGDKNYVMLPKKITFDRLTSEYTEPAGLGEKEGKIKYTYNGWDVGEVSVTITDEKYNEIHGIKVKETKESEKKGNKAKMPTVLIVILVVIIILAIAVGSLFGYVAYKRKKLEEKRRARRRQR